MKERGISFLKGIRGSYCLVFFSNHSLFAVCLLIASFLDPCVGASGLICTIFTLILSNLFGLNPALIQNGTYSFNSLLTGLALGVYFKFSGNFLVMLLIASVVNLFITLFLASVTDKNKLPFLSLPFILTIWILLLNTRSFESSFLIPKEAGACATFWGTGFKDLSLVLENSFPGVVGTYFKSMALIFFQSHFLSGILITMGLLIYSRIAFTLSVIGFLTGMLYMRFIQGNLNDQEYAALAFNYILTALGLGGYFLIASRGSFLLVIFTAPLLGLLSTAIYKLVGVYYLPLYSLPFSVTVILVMSLLNNRYFFKYFNLVYFQKFSPEKNLYAFYTYTERFKKHTEADIHLPFFGEWSVSQGHNGTMTHKGDWRFAFDFVVTDEQNRTYKFPGKSLSDFFCYGLPVLAPADGVVITVEDGVEDNLVGDANLLQNWGNTLIVKHAENLYSKLSHLKKGSFKVKAGDRIKKGDLLALCGNSGRSPEPHLHFQLQASEYIGAPTIDFPISSYIVSNKGSFHLQSYDVPRAGEVLLRPAVSPVLKKAFHFIPGMKFEFRVNEEGKVYQERWEVFTDMLNNSYLKCARTGALAFFKCNDVLFYFTAFEGNADCLLFYFYLGAYKISLSDLDNLDVRDKLPVEGVQRGPVKLVQDFVAPFYIFIQPAYSSQVLRSQDSGHRDLKIVSKINTGGLSRRQINCEILLTEKGIMSLILTENKKCITATSED